MFPHPRPFAVGLLLSVSAAAWQPIHSSGRGPHNADFALWGGGPLVNLNVVVLDAAARPIAGARLTIGAEVRRTDGGGFVNFAVQGPALVEIIAPGYIPKRVDLPPGNHRVHLEASRPRLSDPCGARENPTDNRLECARSIAARSVHWRACTDLGNDVACHRYARDVATALARAEIGRAHV